MQIEKFLANEMLSILFTLNALDHSMQDESMIESIKCGFVSEFAGMKLDENKYNECQKSIFFQRE